jgi:hypothetical protein
MFDSDVRDALLRQAHALYDHLARSPRPVAPEPYFASNHCSAISPRRDPYVELVLHCAEANSNADYYFVDHLQECLFWVDDFKDFGVTDEQQTGQIAVAWVFID